MYRRNGLLDFPFGFASALARDGDSILRGDRLIRNLAWTHRSICLALDLFHLRADLGMLGGDVMLFAKILGQVVRLPSIARPQTFPIVDAHSAALLIHTPVEALVLAQTPSPSVTVARHESLLSPALKSATRNSTDRIVPRGTKLRCHKVTNFVYGDSQDNPPGARHERGRRQLCMIP